MGNVPNTLHFIAPVEPFNNGELTNILSWATSNLCYSVSVWCADGHIDDIRTRLVEVSRFLPEIKATVPESTPMQSTVYFETAEGAQTITILPLKSIKPLSPWEVLFVEYTVFKRKQVVRQIASFWVLNADNNKRLMMVQILF